MPPNSGAGMTIFDVLLAKDVALNRYRQPFASLDAGVRGDRLAGVAPDDFEVVRTVAEQ